MRVLFVTTSYPTPTEPAAGTFVREHALAAAEHADVAVLHLARGEPLGLERVESEPVPLYRSGFPHRPAAAGLLTAAVRAWPRMPRHDLVHAHFFLAGAAAALLDRRPLVLTEHWSVFLPEDPMELSPALWLSARLAFRRARFVLPVSRALERGILEVEPSARTEVVPNAVDTDLFHPDGAQDPGRIASVGLFYEAKGHDLLLDAFREVAASHPGAHLDIVGDGDLRPALERRAAGLPVTFHGVLPKPKVAELVRTAQLFVVASRFETSAVAGIEALASGTPVVGTPVGAIPELVGDDNGVLAGPDGLSRAILDGLARTFDRDAIASSARERYGREAVGRTLMEIYRTSIGSS